MTEGKQNWLSFDQINVLSRKWFEWFLDFKHLEKDISGYFNHLNKNRCVVFCLFFSNGTFILDTLQGSGWCNFNFYLDLAETCPHGLKLQKQTRVGDNLAKY